MPSKKLIDEMNYTGETFKRVDLSNKSLTGCAFSDCRFVSCNFSETSFKNCRFIECSFSNCTMKLMSLNGTTFSRTEFGSCDLLGVNWTEANWQDWTTKIKSIAFDECNLKYAVFLGLELKKLKMTNCTAQEVNFAETDLTDAVFTDTDLAGAIFLRTNLTNASFARAKNYTMNLNDNQTKGTKFSLPEAVRLLYSTDIVIVDPDTEEEITPDS